MRANTIIAIKDELKALRDELFQAGDVESVAELDFARSKLLEPMQLAIIGKISSSKSTLVNAILGKDHVMATGQMEVTYNVGWLKYGDPESDIIIHHKDGSEPTRKSPSEFKEWTTVGAGREEMLNNVSYIELFDDAEILRHINIIDTPGLDAERRQDSQNTLDFISKVRPDAVIMLYTHSIADTTLEEVKKFNGGGSFNPLNAIGVLAKMDVLWMEDPDREQSALKIGQRLAKSKLTKEPILRKTLFDICPISSLMFLRASTLSEKELNIIKELVKNDADVLPRLLRSSDRFVGDRYEVSVDNENRKWLLSSLDLYAISLLIDAVTKNSEISLDEARELLRVESGADDFMKILHNHFGSRADLIKFNSIYATLLRGNAKLRSLAAKIYFNFDYEFKEYELLNRVYNNQLDIDNETELEIFNLCGVNGTSAPQKLGLATTDEVAVVGMLDRARARERHWRCELNREFDPDEKQWKEIMLASYTRLIERLQLMSYQYQQAKAFLFNR